MSRISTMPSPESETIIENKEDIIARMLRDSALLIEAGDPEKALDIIDETRKRVIGLVFEENFPGTVAEIEGEDFKITFPRPKKKRKKRKK